VAITLQEEGRSMVALFRGASGTLVLEDQEYTDFNQKGFVESLRYKFWKHGINKAKPEKIKDKLDKSKDPTTKTACFLKVVRKR